MRTRDVVRTGALLVAGGVLYRIEDVISGGWWPVARIVFALLGGALMMVSAADLYDFVRRPKG